MNNPYTENGNRKMLQSLVCYVDILGFKNFTIQSFKNNSGDEFLDRIRICLKQAYSNIVAKNYGSRSFSLKVFTDNLVIGFPVREPRHDFGEPELGRIFRILSEFQTNLLLGGFFVRGAISYGSHFMDDQIVFGDALIESHEIGEKTGPPRVLLCDSVIKLINRHISWYACLEKSPHFQDLLCDSEGSIFLNYLREAFALFPDGEIFFDLLETHKNRVEENLGIYANNLYVRKKYEWVALYHNFLCEEFSNQVYLSEFPDSTIPGTTSRDLIDKLHESKISNEKILGIESISRLSTENFSNIEGL